MNKKVNDYIQPLTQRFLENADPEKAQQMSKYMRNLCPFFGIPATVSRPLMKDFLKSHGLPANDIFNDVMKTLWQLDQREYQYAAMLLMEKAMKKAEKERIRLYEWAIQEKSWWDTVDYLSGTMIGWHMRMYPDLVQPVTRQWMDSGNIWLQRSALLYQLKYKKETDTSLISDYIEELKGSREFFIRKAIGWILREYSKTNPAWVEQFISENHDLSGLSKREGMKVINRKRS